MRTAILLDTDWYSFLIPTNQLKVDSLEKLENMTDFAIMALKAYMDRYFKFEKERWEDEYLEYAELEQTDNNFVEEYNIKYSEETGDDGYAEELTKFVEDASVILNDKYGLGQYQMSALQDQFVLFDFRHHLYAPLICVKKSNLKIQISPVSLNEDEKKIVDYLDSWVKNHGSELGDKSLFLLRNKSKIGMGFFEAGNFYPDFILWVDTPAKQFINFIDPKGLLHVPPHNPKIQFYKKIKELEARLAPTASGKPIVLKSFIMSVTTAGDLHQAWGLDAKVSEEMNVYTLDDAQCVEKMMTKMMVEGNDF